MRSPIESSGAQTLAERIHHLHPDGMVRRVLGRTAARIGRHPAAPAAAAGRR